MTPPQDCYKVNVDGALYRGIGVVICNDKGQLMGAMSKALLLGLHHETVARSTWMELSSKTWATVELG